MARRRGTCEEAEWSEDEQRAGEDEEKRHVLTLSRQRPLAVARNTVRAAPWVHPGSMAELFDQEAEGAPTYDQARRLRAEQALDLLFIHADGALGRRGEGLQPGGLRLGGIAVGSNGPDELAGALDDLRFDLAHLADSRGIDPRALGSEWGADDLYEDDATYWSAVDRAASALALHSLGIRRGRAHLSGAGSLEPRGFFRRLGDTLINGNLDRDGLSEEDFAYVQHHMDSLDDIAWRELIDNGFGLTHVLDDALRPDEPGLSLG